MSWCDEKPQERHVEVTSYNTIGKTVGSVGRNYRGKIVVIRIITGLSVISYSLCYAGYNHRALVTFKRVSSDVDLSERT